MRLMTWRALSISLGLMDSARHVIGCHSTQKVRVQDACDDVVSTFHESLPRGQQVQLPHRGDCSGHAYALAQRQVFTLVPLIVSCSTPALLRDTLGASGNNWLNLR